MKIGVSSYSFKRYMSNGGVSYLDICDKAKELGFDGLDFIELDPIKFSEGETALECASKIRKHCDDLGLEIAAYTIGANFLSEDMEAEVARVCACVDVAEALGAKVMRHDVCSKLPAKHLYNWRDAINDMTPYIRRVTEYAKEKGIRTCTENHGHIFQEPQRVEELIRSVGSENYGWLCDIGNFLCADVDPHYAVSIAAPYTFHVHAKDFLFKSGELDKPSGFFVTRGGNYIRGTIVGHGIVPVRACLEVIKKAGYDGWVSLEFEGPEDNIVALEQGLAYLRKLTRG